ncbi:MAG TPA: beta/gamma crystallin-related protein, partial [Usitatibacter sp.]|nr:beta/gamma crystallin-related protein [Usitatibacter sp.]
MKRIAGVAFAAAAGLCGLAQAAEMTIFKQPNFSGDEVTVREGARDLAPLGITDQASSLVVRDGRWQVCTQPDYRGDCRVIGPGEYATLDPVLNHRIESVRHVERIASSRERGRHARSWDDPYANESGYERGYDRPGY